MSSQSEQLQSDIRLIQEVEKHTNLYDPRCKDKDPKSREQTWYLIGHTVGFSPEFCKNRWKNLRDKYTREKKLMMTEGEESYRNHPWPLLDEMSFLWNFVSHRKQPTIKSCYQVIPPHVKVKKYMVENNSQPLKLTTKSQEWMHGGSGGNVHDNDDSNDIEPSVLDPACVLIEEDHPIETNDDDDEDSGPPGSKLRKLLESKDEEVSYEDSQNENLTDSNYHSDSLASLKVPQPPRVMDEEEYFCMSLAASLRRLSKQKCSLLKIKIMQMLHEEQFGESSVK